MSRFKDWQATSLFRRTVVAVATFTMLACVSIATMSFVAVSATKAVFKPTPDAASTNGNGPSGNSRNGKSAKPAGAKTPALSPDSSPHGSSLNAGAD
jgi:hypothetical protein